MGRRGVIRGTGMYVPERIVLNEEFNKLYGRDVDTFLREKRNIRQRRYMAQDQATSDLIVPAAEQAGSSKATPMSQDGRSLAARDRRLCQSICLAAIAPLFANDRRPLLAETRKISTNAMRLPAGSLTQLIGGCARLSRQELFDGLRLWWRNFWGGLNTCRFF